MRPLRLICLCLCLPLIACNDDGGSTEQSSTGDGDGDATTGDGDGDPTTGDGDGDPTTGDGDGDGDPTTGDGDGDGDGDPTTGDGDGDPITGECTSVEQCELINDCCSCEVVVAGTELPCDITECLLPTCEAEFSGFAPSPACRVGTCSFAPLSCDLGDVGCESPEPAPCENGLVRSVINNCYGSCVPANLCATLPSECDAQTCGDGFACMTSQSGGSSSCMPLPPGCDGQPSCDCVAPWWNEVCGGGCGEAGGSLICEDGG